MEEHLIEMEKIAWEVHDNLFRKGKGLEQEKVLNYIMRIANSEDYLKMYENKISFKETLEQAIKNGFAEQDSSADLSGKDAMHKLVLLSNISFGKKFKFSDMHYDGIENIKLIDLEQGLNLGYKLKLVSL